MLKWLVRRLLGWLILPSESFLSFDDTKPVFCQQQQQTNKTNPNQNNRKNSRSSVHTLSHCHKDYSNQTDIVGIQTSHWMAKKRRDNSPGLTLIQRPLASLMGMAVAQSNLTNTDGSGFNIFCHGKQTCQLVRLYLGSNQPVRANSRPSTKNYTTIPRNNDHEHGIKIIVVLQRGISREVSG